MTTSSLAPAAMAAGLTLCLLTACANLNSKSKKVEAVSPTKFSPDQVSRSKVSPGKPVAQSHIADPETKSSYRLKGDYAGGGMVGSFIGQLTVKDLINNLLDRRSSEIDLHNNLAYSDRLTREALTIFQKRDVSFVRWLDLTGAQLSDSDLEPISKLNLSELDLSANLVKDLHAIKNITSLRTLNLSQCPINRQGIAVVSSLGNLRVLNLNDTAVRDSDLVSLHSLKQLRQLELVGCSNLREAAVEAFRAQSPLCNLHFGKKQTLNIFDGMHTLDRIESTLGRQGDYDQVDASVERFIGKWLSQSPPPYVLIARGYHMRGKCQTELNNLKKAERMYGASLDIYQRHLPDDPNIPVVQCEWASILPEMDCCNEAIQLRNAADGYWQGHRRDSSAEKSYQANLIALKRLGKLHQ